MNFEWQTLLSGKEAILIISFVAVLLRFVYRATCGEVFEIQTLKALDLLKCERPYTFCSPGKLWPTTCNL